ncbi:hypothetical protein [Alteromonas sp. A079]|uniref:hypothetical protein n=1 Tax=Alteromonas sp. A079 TaxID=3410268 RepID=UPI003BA3BB22
MATPLPFSASDICEMRIAAPARGRWRDAKSISLAVAIHVLAFIAVMISTTFSSLPPSYLSPAQTTPPVRAALYFQPSTAKTPTNTDAAKQPTNTPLQSAEAPPINEGVTHPDNQVVPTSQAEMDNETASEDAFEQVPLEAIEKPGDSDFKTQQATTSDQPISTDSAVTNYFRDYNNAQLREDAQQASTIFRKRKTSPVLIDPTYERDINPDEQRVVKKVNCTGTTNKVLTLLSGLAGGTLKCTDRGNADQFIEKRIKKVPDPDNSQR